MKRQDPVARPHGRSGERGRPDAAVLLGAGAVVLGLVFVAAVAAGAGPLRLDPERWLTFELGFAPAPDPGVSAPEMQPQPDPPPAREGDITFVIVAFTVLVAVLLTVLLVKLMKAMQDDVEVEEAEPEVATPFAAPPGSVAGQLRDAAGALTLRSVAPGESRDAVVSCWLRLEAAAAEAGSGRDPASTPSEFTAALLTEHHADPEAVGDLLDLYHRARFGASPLPDEAANRALRALERAAAGLSGERLPAGSA
jgi:hypothetical protein